MEGTFREKPPKELKGYWCCKCEKQAEHIHRKDKCAYHLATFCNVCLTIHRLDDCGES